MRDGTEEERCAADDGDYRRDTAPWGIAARGFKRFKRGAHCQGFCRAASVSAPTTSFDKARAKAQREGLNFHDLRSTAEDRLRESGCTEAEAYSVTGRETSGSARAYFKRSDALSRVAMQKLEAQFGNNDCKNLVKIPYTARQKG